MIQQLADRISRALKGYREWSGHFGTYVPSLLLHFWKRLFPELEPMTSWSQDNSFTATSGLPFTGIATFKR
jgi:hypothetical protein